MNYKIQNQSASATTENWVVHSEDYCAVLSEEDAAQYTDDSAFRHRFDSYIVADLVRKLIDTGAIKIETEYDCLRQHTFYAARLKYLQEE